MKKQYQIVILIAVTLVAGGVGYFAGTYTGPRGLFFAGDPGGFQNLSPDERAVRFGQAGARTGRTGGAGGVGGGFATGEVIGKDAQGITVKLTDGSSKIIFVASSTSFTKSSKVSVTDVAVGSNVMITGSTNTDGSITARGIDIRPDALPD